MTPRASADRIDGLAVDAAGILRLRVRVRAVAEKNRANRALEALVADRLGIAKSTVRVVAGHTSRIKIIRIDRAAGLGSGALESLASGA